MTGENPYQPSNVTSPQWLDPSRRYRWLSAIFILVIGYYALSSLTLPLVDEFWLGELPVFAIFQLPKAFVFRLTREALMALMRGFGISSGSPSPDMIASAPWAFAILFIMPSLVVLGITRIFQTFRERRLWVCILLAAAMIDAITTIWSEKASRLTLF